jgi:hypothetical protein
VNLKQSDKVAAVWTGIVLFAVLGIGLAAHDASGSEGPTEQRPSAVSPMDQATATHEQNMREARAIGRANCLATHAKQRWQLRQVGLDPYSIVESDFYCD